MNYANQEKIYFQHFHLFGYFFYEICFTYIKMSKDLSAKYYQNNKERLQKNLIKDIKSF